MCFRQMLPSPQDYDVAKDKQRRETFDPAKFLTGHGAGQSRIQFAPHHVIFAQGDRADALFLIESGWVKITYVSPSGKEMVIALRGDGKFVGTRSLILRHRTATVTTLTGCSLIRVTTSALIDLLREEPDFAEMFTTYLVRQSLRGQVNLISQLHNSAERRLARVLLQLASYAPGPDPQPVSMHINQADLANMIGTTRSRVSFFLNKFKRQGFIEYDHDGHLSVRGALVRFLREP